ncbi:MAG: peptidase C39 family protein [Chloroflexota bacterium]
MNPVQLKVPHLQQSSDGECVAVCAAMVLEYLDVDVKYQRILKLLGTQPFGTISSQLSKLESLKLTVVYKRGTFDELYEHLSNNRPCIAFVMTGELPYWTEDKSHAVVVAGLDDDFIYINDPDLDHAPIQVPRGDFDLAWLEWDEMYATLIKK